MKLSIISFTENGICLSKNLAKRIGQTDVVLFAKCRTYFKDQKEMQILSVEKSIGEWAKEQMQERNALIFIGACGIAVRAIAPYLADKLHDSPVLVMDESGRYIIPLLSGHMGGANELALFIAEKMGATPIITTATDINRKFAVDIFAKRNGLFIVNKDGIAKVSAKVLAEKEITMSVQQGHCKEDCRIPEGIRIVSYPPKEYVDIVITSKEGKFDAAILLKPREYVIGMGCRKGKEEKKIENFIRYSVKEFGISFMQIAALASIDLKSTELGLLAWSRKENIPFLTYTAEELQSIEGNFHKSDFVKDKTGADNVCERAALKACGIGGKLVYEKHAEDGMTIAIAQKEWSVKFDET